MCIKTGACFDRRVFKLARYDRCVERLERVSTAGFIMFAHYDLFVIGLSRV